MLRADAARDEHLLLRIAQSDEQQIDRLCRQARKRCGDVRLRGKAMRDDADAMPGRKTRQRFRGPLRYAGRAAKQADPQRARRGFNQGGHEIRAVEIGREAPAFEPLRGDVDTDAIRQNQKTGKDSAESIIPRSDVRAMSVEKGDLGECRIIKPGVEKRQRVRSRQVTDSNAENIDCRSGPWASKALHWRMWLVGLDGRQERHVRSLEVLSVIRRACFVCQPRRQSCLIRCGILRGVRPGKFFVRRTSFFTGSPL